MVLHAPPDSDSRPVVADACGSEEEVASDETRTAELDDDSISALIRFFTVLDEWDREAEKQSGGCAAVHTLGEPSRRALDVVAPNKVGRKPFAQVKESRYHEPPPQEVQEMIAAVAYARVSSREQEREGYSIPAQRKLLAEYARTHGFHIEREFIDVESAKNPGRKEFGQMLRLLEADDSCRVVMVEKTDRLYRKRTDALAFESLIEKRSVEIHLVKEARVICRNSCSQDKFMHDIHVAAPDSTTGFGAWLWKIAVFSGYGI